MNLDLFDFLKENSLFEHLPEPLRELWNSTMAEFPESVGIVPEMPKSPRTPRSKKDKQAMVSVCMSPRNPLRTRLTMEENGKAINLEVDEEEEFEEILVEEEEDVEMEVETQGADPLTRLPAYVPSRKGKPRVPKDIDESKSSLQTPLLPDDIIFEGAHLGRVLVLKFEDWDLAEH